MKIIYISHLSTNIAAGMNWSVPASIKAQEKIDEVLWINTTNVVMPHWRDTKAYRNLKDIGEKLKIEIVPKPFNHPDVVVFEGLYFKEYLSFAKELRREKIPYIIVPRGSMTHQAMHNHSRWKKFFAHLLYFNSFIRHAWRIQYLTQQEADDSRQCFHTPYFIVPNGVTMPAVKKKKYSGNAIHAISIGRLDIYHKGLDLLLDAVRLSADELRKANFTLTIYGPPKYDYQQIVESIEKHGLTDFVTLRGEVSGKEKEQALLNADFFIMTSRFEGHPMGLIEALAYGLPCLVTPGTNMAKEIKAADAGWICEGSAGSVRVALLNAIYQTATYSKKSQQAKKLASSYDWNLIAEEFYKNIVCLNKNH